MTGSHDAMSRPALDRARSDLKLHDHAVCLYEDEAALGAALAAFVREGAGRHELCVLIHSFGSDDDAWRFLEASCGGEGPPRDDIVLVALYTEAFQGGKPRIDHAHVAEVVGSLTARARTAGHSGVRLFVDASRRYLGEGRADEWFEFEAWLGRRLQAEVGLVCAYQRSDALDPANVARVLATHAYRFGASG